MPSSIASFKYSGSLDALDDAVCRALDRLKVRRELIVRKEGGFAYAAHERLRLLSTNWPVTYQIIVASSAGAWAVTVEAGSKLSPITQDAYNSTRAQELADLIITLVPA
jgi:hypothetical protein